jgi:hypothetical protein
MLFISDAKADSRSSFMGIANVRQRAEVSSESLAKRRKGKDEPNSIV